MEYLSRNTIEQNAGAIEQQIEKLQDLLAEKRGHLNNLDRLGCQIDTIIALKTPGLKLIGMLKLRSEQLAVEERELATIEDDMSKFLVDAEMYDDSFGLF